MNYNHTVFSVPSPYQASLLIKKTNSTYNEDLMNSVRKHKNYNSNFKKALNLGIYGADLGYLTVYEQSQNSLKYVNCLRNLSRDLGLLSVFEDEIVQKFENNLDHLDSLFSMLSDTYRGAGAYLIDNNRSHIGALIIAGGWIESMYFLTQSNLPNRNYLITNRIGEQKKPLENLIDVLSPYYYKDEMFSSLIDQLVDLAYDFDGVISNYHYKAPQIDTINKISYINSESNIIMSEYHSNTISEKIKNIRTQITK